MDVSVVVPTIGRPAALSRCLTSLFACRPLPREVVVVDQSGGEEVAATVAPFAPVARTVTCAGRGVARAINRGLREARHDTVLKTDDDCTVAPTWVGRGHAAMAADARRLVAGRVLPVGDRARISSLREDPSPHEYVGEARHDLLSGNNMVLNRPLVLEAGGFDERFPFAAEDVDFCYRWTSAGRRLSYDPELVVWHHHWRTTKELEELYVEYWRGAGWFYGKHLRDGDLRVLRMLGSDLAGAAKAVASAVVKRRERWTDDRRGALGGLPRGLREGWAAGPWPAR